MSETGLHFTEEQLAQLVAARVAEVLTSERLESLARERIDQRVGTLTLQEALGPLQSSNVRQLRDKCAKYGIPIVKLGNKTEGIRIRDIEAAQEQYAFRIEPRKALAKAA